MGLLDRYEQWKKGTAHVDRKPGSVLAQLDDAYWRYSLFPSEDSLLILGDCLSAVIDWVNAGTDPKAKTLDKDGALDELSEFVLAELEPEEAPASRDLNVAMLVRDQLKDVRIADVDFSPNVTRAAKAKMIEGKNLYDIVKAEWDTPDQDRGSSRAELDRALANMKLPMGPSPKAGAKTIAELVLKHKFAVCESIAATAIHLCLEKGFAGRLELIGIPYDKAATAGHAIVVANRSGELGKPETWGDDFFIIDMWYYNLGMKHLAIWAGSAKDGYVAKDIAPYVGTGGGLKCLLDTDTPTGAPAQKKKNKLSALLERNAEL